MTPNAATMLPRPETVGGADLLGGAGRNRPFVPSRGPALSCLVPCPDGRPVGRRGVHVIERSARVRAASGAWRACRAAGPVRAGRLRARSGSSRIWRRSSTGAWSCRAHSVALFRFAQGCFGPLHLRLRSVVFFLALPRPLLGCLRLVLGVCGLPARSRTTMHASSLGTGIIMRFRGSG
jgi:hypothetical protein